MNPNRRIIKGVCLGTIPNETGGNPSRNPILETRILYKEKKRVGGLSRT